ncbi:nucleoside deaminase [Candidatus Bathyarchaeota archaeon]|nr:nucleoside deaminase [Candidatus Bathyarchaeota archaeon]
MFVQSKPVEEPYTPLTKLKAPPNHPGHLYTDILVEPNRWIEEACEEARMSVEAGGGPFGAVLIQVDDETDRVLRYWRDRNHVTEYKDPTAHAEVSVIRSACRELDVYDLGTVMRPESRLPQAGETSHCEIYSSCEPCPMCYAAIKWARIPVMVFSATRHEASHPDVGFSDKDVYEDLEKNYQDRDTVVRQAVCTKALDAFEAWKRSGNLRY